MTNGPLLRVDRLELRNFRCFAECTIELNDHLTVLVAENGRGKTAILDAIGIALGLFVNTVANTRQLGGFDRADVRVVQGGDGAMSPSLPTSFATDGYVAGQPVHWSRALGGYGPRARTTTKKAEPLREAAEKLSHPDTTGTASGQHTVPLLPLVAFYGTGRLWSEHRLTKAKRTYATAPDGRMSGYTDCLSSSSSFKGVLAWYENKMKETRDPRFSTDLSKNLALIAAVQEATRLVLEPTGWSALDWDFEHRSLVVRHPDHGRLPLSALSDGVRNMVALVADIARRCASLNAHLSDAAARLTPGVLLIDEVDMHLHPRWQQGVVELLRTAFPALQMILSTHSPQVLSTVDRRSIRMIRLREGRGVVETPATQTRGVESADVLARIMGIDPVPQVEEALALSRYRQLIQLRQEGSEDGTKLRAGLDAHFGPTHPVMLECDRLVRLELFKAKLPPSTTPSE